MKNMTLFLIMFCVFSFGQNVPLAVKINSITSSDSMAARRVYKINYQIENKTSHEVQFFLKPTSLIAQAASSLTLFAVYKMYRNGIYDAMDGPFYEKMYAEQDEIQDLYIDNPTKAKAFVAKLQEKYDKQKKESLENYKLSSGTSTDENWILKNQNLLKSIVILKPNEIKTFTIETSWRRNRYFKIEDNEYYLDEKDKFEIQLHLILNKSNRQDNLSEKEFLEIKNNPNFLQGTVESNRMEISFN